MLNGSYYISDIQDYFEISSVFSKKHNQKIDNPSISSIKIYVNKIQTWSTFQNIILFWVFNTWHNEITWKIE